MNVLRLTPPTQRLNAAISVPGSKSYTNRALVMAALAPGVSHISHASMSTDCEALMAALRSLGVTIEVTGTDALRVTGRGGNLLPFRGTFDIGPAGTTIRFLTALCSAIPGADIVLCGTERMHARPIGALVSAMQAAGASIDYLGTPGCPPLRIHSAQRLRGGAISVDGSTSSQFITAILLVAPLFTEGLTLTVTGEQVSTSYLDMTMQSLRGFGLDVSCDGYNVFRVAPGQSFTPRSYEVEGDGSGASYLWALAAVSRGTVRVDNFNPDSAQGDSKFPLLLERMGCRVVLEPRSVTVEGPKRLTAIEANMELMPDVAQTLAVIAACAEGTTIIRGLGTLRVKETDRIAAMHAELAKMGIHTETGPDYIVVHGGVPHGARIATYEDHRIAMSFATLAARIPGIEIEHPNVVEKSFPTFWKTINSVGITTEEFDTI